MNINGVEYVEKAELMKLRAEHERLKKQIYKGELITATLHYPNMEQKIFVSVDKDGNIKRMR